VRARVGAAPDRVPPAADGGDGEGRGVVVPTLTQPVSAIRS
jgi:hypothetical protein